MTRGERPQAVAKEWAYVRIIDKDTGRLKAPNTRGRPEEKAQCVFCGETRSAQPGRIRCHVAGIKVASSGNIHPCQGPKRDTDMDEASLNELILVLTSRLVSVDTLQRISYGNPQWRRGVRVSAQYRVASTSSTSCPANGRY